MNRLSLGNEDNVDGDNLKFFGEIHPRETGSTRIVRNVMSLYRELSLTVFTLYLSVHPLSGRDVSPLTCPKQWDDGQKCRIVQNTVI